MALTYQRCQEIREKFMNRIIQTNNIPSDLVNPFFDFYNTEFKVGAYGSMPCTCSGKVWSHMVGEVVNEILRVEKEEEIRLYAREQAQKVVSGS